MKGLTVHEGFLNSATRLSSLVARQLNRANKDTPGFHVIFTGHSAGGAVASLLFLKSLLEAPTLCECQYLLREGQEPGPD